MLLHRIKWFAGILCFIAIIGAATAGYSQDNRDQVSAWRQAAAAGDADAFRNDCLRIDPSSFRLTGSC